MIERTTVRLPSALLDRARKKAAEEGRTVTSLLEEGLKLALDPDRGKRENEPIRYPRISIVASKRKQHFPTFREIEETDDIEYAKRMDRGFKD